LPNQLDTGVAPDRAVTVFVYITSRACARRLSVDEHSKRYGSLPRGRSHDEVEIARMKPVRDPPAGSVQHGSLCLHRPFTGKRPLIEAQARRKRIAVTRVQHGTARRREILGFAL
jgi:hypothetical protein